MTPMRCPTVRSTHGLILGRLSRRVALGRPSGRPGIPRFHDSICLVVLLLPSIHWPAPALAGDILTHVPSDTAGVISIRNLGEFSEKLSGFARRLNTGCGGLNPDEFETLFGLDPGTMDTSRPIHVLLHQPDDLMTFFRSSGLGEGDHPFPVVAFTPKDPATFGGKLGPCAAKEQQRTGPFGVYWVQVRDDLVFVAEKRRRLRHVLQTTPDRSLAATVDQRTRALCEESDLFLHLPMDRWRARLSPFVLFAVNLMKVKITADQTADEREQMAPLVNWFLDGLQRLVDEMRSVSVGLDFDGTTFRLTHSHAFRAGGAVAAYLRQVRRIDLPLGHSLPDRPFFALSLIQWRTPVEHSVTKRLCDVFFAADCPGAKADRQLRQRLRDSMLYCADQLHGMEFMLTSPPGRLFPAQVIGADVVADAPAALNKYRFVQENAGELMSTMVCGGAGSFGTFKEIRTGDDRYLELELGHEAIPEASRRQMCQFYGEGVRYQQGVAGQHHIAYALSAPPGGIAEVFETLRSGRNITRNAEVARIRARVPDDAHAVVILDIGRVLQLVPYLKEDLGESADEPRSDPATCADDARAGPLLGWSCTVTGDALSCCLAVDANDVMALVQRQHKDPSVDP